MTKLTTEEKDELVELQQSPVWNAVLTLCKIAVERHENGLLNSSLTDSDRELLIKKAKLEGARDVERTFQNVKEQAGSGKKKV